MHFDILGSPEVYDEDTQRRAHLTGKQRQLVGVLLAAGNCPVSRESLIRELWGARPPAGAHHTVGVHVSCLRRALAGVGTEHPDGARLVTREGGWLLCTRPEERVHERFCRSVSSARASAAEDPQGGHAALHTALAAWRGPAFDGVARGPLCAAFATRLEEERHEARELLFDCALRLGRHRQIVPELEEAAAAGPLRERLHEQLMVALCRSGRGGDAIGVYTRARGRLTAAHGHTPLLTARLEQIGSRSPALYGEDEGQGSAVPRIPSVLRASAVAGAPYASGVTSSAGRLSLELAARPPRAARAPTPVGDTVTGAAPGPSVVAADAAGYATAVQEPTVTEPAVLSVSGFLTEILSGAALRSEAG